MPSLEELQFVQGISQRGAAQMKQEDATAKYKAAAQVASQKLLAGDPTGAAAAMFEVDPDLTRQVLPQMAGQFNPELQGQVRGAQTTADLSANSKYGNTERQRLDATLASQERVAKTKDKEKPSASDSARNRVYTKAYDEFVTRGGAAKLISNIQKVDEVIDELGSSDTVSGPIVGNLWDPITDLFTPEGKATRDRAQGVLIQGVREILGGSVTEEDRRAVVKAGFNEKLSEAENKKRMQTLRDQLKMAADAQIEAADYYQKNDGDMRGFKGKIVTSVQDILALDPKGNGGTKKMTYKPGTKAKIQGRDAIIGADGESYEFMDGKK